MGLIDDLIVGNEYTKEYFDITFPALLKTDQIIEGKAAAFYTMNNQEGFKNEMHQDGFVFEVRDKLDIPPIEIESKDNRHIFVRENPDDNFVYYGKGKYKKRYSDTQIKIFW